MLQLIIDTGFMGLVLIVLAVLALALIIERLIAYRRESTMMEHFSREFSEAVKARQYEAAAAICDRHHGFAPRVYRLAVEHQSKGAVTLRVILNNYIDFDVLPRLQARLGALVAIAKGAPMVGLMGTVYGMMGAFATIAGTEGQGVDPKELAGDIGLALGTTFLGLLVAVPVVFTVAYLKAKVQQFETDLDRYTHHCIDLLCPGNPPTVATGQDP